MATDATQSQSDAPALVDHHCHGIVCQDLDRSAFELLISESAHPAGPGMSHFDTPLGLAIRRWCAPVLDCEPGIDPDSYLDRRAALGAAEANRRLLMAAGLDVLLVDTGHGPVNGTSLTDLADLAAAAVHEVVRIEQVAEEVLEGIVSPRDFIDGYEASLRSRSVQAVALKSIVAYRSGLDLAPSPDQRAVESAVEQVLVGARDGMRLDHPVLLRHGLDVAGEIGAELGLPVQIHTGFGDTDLQLNTADPALLTPLLRQYEAVGATVTLLHCYPYQREAGYLASVFPHVYFDVGLAVPHVGASSKRVIAEALELAPFDKHLFSSDAFGLAELYLVAAKLFHRSIREVLDDWVASGDCTATDAARIHTAVAGGTARRIYRLDRE